MINYDFLYDRSHYKNDINIDHLVETELSWTTYDEAIVQPFKRGYSDVTGGLLDKAGNYIDGSGLHKGMGFKYEYDETAVEYRDETAILLGVWPDIWGHWLTDNIRRLWVLKNKEFMARYGHLKFIYIPYFNNRICKNASELLEMLGGDKVKLVSINKPVKYKKIILPDECFFSMPDGDRFFTKEYTELIDDIREYAKERFVDTGIRKVYFSYRNYSAIRAMGEYRLEGFFGRMGYKVISPEKYSFKEQLNILLNASEFASTVGSASHNIIFLRDNTKVYLIPRNDSITKYQFALDQVHDLDITYVDSSLSLYLYPDCPWGGPFYFIISENLLRCFGKKMRRMNNSRGFMIYRQLGYWLNGCQKPGDYYKKEYKKYLDISEKQVEEYSWIFKFLEKIYIQKVVMIILKKLIFMLSIIKKD